MPKNKRTLMIGKPKVKSFKLYPSTYLTSGIRVFVPANETPFCSLTLVVYI